MAEPTQTNISQTTIPDYAKPYVETLLGKAEAVTDINKNPYVAYPGQRTADFVKLQNDAFAAAGNLGPASQLTDATDLAQRAGLGALGTRYDAGQFGPQQFAQQVGGYMSPYIQQALIPQMREARRQAEIGATQQQAQATQSGAFGGARDAIMRAERERNLATQLGDIQATGLQNAYMQAANQYQQGAQFGEQSRQFGAGLGLQGLQTGLQAAGALGNLGATQFGQQAQTLGIQNQMGGTQQQQQQNILNQQYQDFLTQKQYPYQQLGFMSDMLRGLPLSQSSTQMYSNPNFLTQAAGAVGTAYMGNKIFNGASGGLPEDFERKERPAGLAELAIYNMA